ncbi:bifunctional demethylmenaquinone methyltransferase/2-methoxy-6-polyprenyl-1,4-benzoquinol methylase UbiE [Litorivicinus lipolyticus]|uniref:Ubiquinone/menaquinone biosynthesis C-methyltransferase UbiE n=1 Tax=Litorivicinus lipolyticus TaxID=418701 RepID=A0A5Q2QBC2_9GAMM|nr:bifunctional demethylmenaquinone methyltransferase/2-methoxy-6-polyprenyl-1,4-benzoquinol methylase UbiE [Litorivicinus lipolyticus]QGG79316.1 bifunctional demethylmenaquinone methyltransferase/2-methoxy-6-polyprenyl-1,4-benzoquinol methylase UbiE [Litorivicinus lipolyticus]
MSDNTTHFGFKDVPVQDKVKHVGQVFDSVAPSYDIMNDLMSMGVHRIWKRIAIEYLAPRQGQRILDLAGGTGDLSLLIRPRIGDAGQLFIGDINPNMLSVGRDRLIDRGVTDVPVICMDAEHLPFDDASLDRVIIGFGLRNVTEKLNALTEMRRVLRPGGRALVLEFSKPAFEPLAKLYDFYSFKLLPKIGKWVAKDEDSYRYLAESIRMHPGQEQLAQMMREAGFDEVRYTNLTGGIVALHTGFVK